MPAPESVVPEAVVPEAVVPEAMAPEAVVPEAMAPEAVVPEAVVPEAMAPEAVALEPAFSPSPPVSYPLVGSAPAPASTDGASGTAESRPEVAIGAAFAGGLVLALILKRLAR